MKSSTLFIQSALLALAAGATIAPNLPDGFYHAYTDEHGVETHIQIANTANYNVPLLSWRHDPSNTTIPVLAHPSHQPQDLEKRCSPAPLSQGLVWCGCTHGLVPSDCDAAVQDLKNQVNSQPYGGIYPKVGNSWYSIRGSVVAFQCPLRDGSTWLQASLISSQLAIITATCGRYIAGSIIGIDLFGNFNDYGLGYMQAYPGLQFCDAEFNPGQNCC